MAAYATFLFFAARIDIPDSRIRRYIASGARSISPGHVNAPCSRYTFAKTRSSHNGSNPSPSGPYDRRGAKSATPDVPSANETSILKFGDTLKSMIDQTAIAVIPRDL